MVTNKMKNLAIDPVRTAENTLCQNPSAADVIPVMTSLRFIFYFKFLMIYWMVTKVTAIDQL